MKLRAIFIFSIFTLSVFGTHGLGQYSSYSEDLNTFITNYHKDGNWDYNALYKKPKPLQDIIYSINKAEWSQTSGNVFIANGVNTYNLHVVKHILDHYPTSSVRDIPDFFSARFIPFGDELLSLDELERKLFSDTASDARLHFVLNCGAVGCPAFPPLVIEADQLDSILTIQTQLALNHDAHVRIDSTNRSVYVSSLFQWYKNDFDKAGGTRAFINRYRDQAIPDDFALRYLSYDWTLNDQALRDRKQAVNLQTFTPSILIPRGQLEWKSFFNLYTQAQQFNGESTINIPRSTYLTTIHKLTFGVLPWLNLGADVWSKQVLSSAGTLGDSPLRILTFPNDSDFDATLSYIGPRFRIHPISTWRRFSFQSSFLLPVGSDMENRSNGSDRPFLFLEWDRSLWITEFFWDKPLGERFQLFSRVAVWSSFTRNSYRLNPFIETPISLFLCAFPTNRWTVYVQNEWWSTHTQDVFDVTGRSNNRFQTFVSFFVQSGLGTKFQVLPGALELEALYTNFWIGSDGQGAGETFNLGVRWISSR